MKQKIKRKKNLLMDNEVLNGIPISSGCQIEIPVLKNVFK